ncbi:diguanylate cyclase domain-containing protein [Actinoplanes sp. URMC 104]|uniref:diguanylate cyclase domain-containing protein n=1 Tax=Actinoplanes sp. URMC 104 TaxID=3423409 RepID=UPI003F1D9C32
MNAAQEPSVLRRRRTVEASALLSRGAGLLCVVLFLSDRLGMPNGIERATPVRIACLAGIALMVVALGLAAVNLRSPGGRHYDLISGLSVVSDTVSIAGIVVSIQAYGQTTWPVLSVAILVAALRKRLPGALLAWAATSGILAGAVLVYGDRVLRPGDLSMAVLSHLLVALLSGTQAGAYARQVAELDAARRQLHHQATHDPLTGLPNRARLATHAESLTGRALAVLALDLNGFKAVNDSLGHAAGDELLRAVGSRLHAALRAGDDLAGRIGGDEFVVVLADAGPDEASALAERLRAAICAPVVIGGDPVTVGVSIGVAVREAGSPAGLGALSHEADAAMYRDKAQLSA